MKKQNWIENHKNTQKMWSHKLRDMDCKKYFRNTNIRYIALDTNKIYKNHLFVVKRRNFEEYASCIFVCKINGFRDI